jgi:mannose-6-phosphate isomerase-like protein (cupin superfamily)
MLVKAADAEFIEEPDNGLVMRRLVNRESHWSSVSATWVALDGRHQRLRNDHSDRIYYVLEGSARFHLDGADLGVAEAGDVVLIPRGTPYELEGRLRYLVVSAPATHPTDNIYLEGVRAATDGPTPRLRAIGRGGTSEGATS